MSQAHPKHPTEFGFFLLKAIRSAGYATPTALAREAGLQPSVLTRLVYGTTKPTAPTLRRIAPLLNLTEAELVTAAYAGAEAAGVDLPPPLPIPIVRLIRAYEEVPETDRKVVLERIEWIAQWVELFVEREGKGMRPKR